jgi:PAS domain S-box-containing protein
VRKTFLTFAAFITVSFVVVGIIFFNQTNALLRSSLETVCERDLTMIEATTRGDLAVKDYEKIEDRILLWGEQDPNIVSLRFILDEDIVFVEYLRGVGSDSVLSIARETYSPGGRKAKVELEYDLSSYANRSRTLAVAFTVFGVLGSTIFILSLWFILHNMAIVPLQMEIQHRKRAEQALQANEGFLRSLLKNVPMGVVLHNADTEILMSNTFAQQLLGLTEDQMFGKAAIDPEWKFVYEDGSRIPLDDYPVNKVIATRNALRNLRMGIFRPSSQDIVWALVSAVPRFDTSGELQHVIVSFMDVTELKHAEEEREDLITKLQNALAEVKTLKGFIPICSYCKKIRNDSGYWDQVEAYISRQTEAQFSHGVCPGCLVKAYEEAGLEPPEREPER